MSDLTKTQIARFEIFRTHIEKALSSLCVPVNRNFVVDDDENVPAFTNILRAVARLSGYNKALNTEKQLDAKGYTKANLVVFNPKTNKPVERNGKPIFRYKARCCRMYTLEAFRALRSEVTGGLADEAVYVLPWEAVSESMQKDIATKFPCKSEQHPAFEAWGIGVIVRKGAKPVSGQTRHQWSRMQFVVLGEYGDRQVAITDAIVWNGETNDDGSPIRRLADATNCPEDIVPIWNAKVETPEELPIAANAQVADQNAFDDRLSF